MLLNKNLQIPTQKTSKTATISNSTDTGVGRSSEGEGVSKREGQNGKSIYIQLKGNVLPCLAEIRVIFFWAGLVAKVEYKCNVKLRDTNKLAEIVR